MHTQEFIRTVESTIIIDDDTTASSSVLPQLGEFGLRKAANANTLLCKHVFYHIISTNPYHTLSLN